MRFDDQLHGGKLGQSAVHPAFFDSAHGLTIDHIQAQTLNHVAQLNRRGVRLAVTLQSEQRVKNRLLGRAHIDGWMNFAGG